MSRIGVAVMQALLGYASGVRWLRHARQHLRHLFPSCPVTTSGWRRVAGTIGLLIAALARDAALQTDDVWVVDSTPVECGRPGETAHRSELAGRAGYGYCA